MEVDEQGKAPKPTKEKRTASSREDDDDDGDSDVEMISVDFDFFDPQPQDYHSLSHLVKQLLAKDAPQFHTGDVADILIEQKLIGTTVKTDGQEGDPYGVLSVLNLNERKATPIVAQLTKYLLERSESSPALHSELSALVASTAPSTSANPTHLGLVLSERLINMPPQLSGPMYKMLDEELGWARDENEPYFFSHLLFLSRVFLASPEELDEDPNASLEHTVREGKVYAGKKRSGKKSKTKGGKEEKEEQTWCYHPEDDFIAQFATHKHVYPYLSKANEEPRDAESFGVEQRGMLMLVPWSRWDELVKGLEGFLSEGIAMAQA